MSQTEPTGPAATKAADEVSTKVYELRTAGVAFSVLQDALRDYHLMQASYFAGLSPDMHPIALTLWGTEYWLTGTMVSGWHVGWYLVEDRSGNDDPPVAYALVPDNPQAFNALGGRLPYVLYDDTVAGGDEEMDDETPPQEAATEIVLFVMEMLLRLVEADNATSDLSA